jgi:hypothetical protein
MCIKDEESANAQINVQDFAKQRKTKAFFAE